MLVVVMVVVVVVRGGVDGDANSALVMLLDSVEPLFRRAQKDRICFKLCKVYCSY